MQNLAAEKILNGGLFFIYFLQIVCRNFWLQLKETDRKFFLFFRGLAIFSSYIKFACGDGLCLLSKEKV